MLIREMKVSDIGQILKIEQACFSDPWSEAVLRESLLGKLDYYWVLEFDGVLAGYLNLRVIAGEGELNRLAVLPAWQGLGGAKKLMDRMVSFTISQGLDAVTLEVRQGNQSARNLYKTYGFQEIAIRCDYYLHPVEDGVIMQRR